MAKQIGLCVERTYQLGCTGVLPVERYGNGHRLLFAPLNGAIFVRGQGGRYRSTKPRLLTAQE